MAGVSLPEPPPRVRSETDRAAALVEEAWAAVVAVVRETPVAGDHPAAQWSAAIRARVAVGWFDPAIVHTHLDRLGMTADTRRRAGLSEEALRTFRPGQVYLREGARGAISFSQQQANGHWVHLLPPRAGGWKPLAFTDAGRGREEVRQVAVALSPEVAVSLAASLRDAASTEGRRYAVLLGGPRQLDVSLDTLTRRAVILVPDEISTTAAIYRTGAELTTRGTAVRVAAVGACSPAHLDESLEFAAWQYHVLRSDVGLEPGSPEAAAWVRDKVVPIAQAAPDPVVGAVLVHRAMQLAVGAALALDAPDVHGVGVTAPTPSAA
ncbi:MAG: hypothetical protein H3C62_09160 [Gemmatimonadaceae bacterium]|nr:hypothetical protein [Gemmatimonadaceae bacterium]